MSLPPDRPRIYHITHIDNLSGILADGGLYSDAAIAARGGPAATIGMAAIKQARLGRQVRCHPGEVVANYVPFYFCPRSIMLYLLYMGNHPNLSYRDGQRPILHLEAGLHEAVSWAESEGRR